MDMRIRELSHRDGGISARTSGTPSLKYAQAPTIRTQSVASTPSKKFLTARYALDSRKHWHRTDRILRTSRIALPRELSLPMLRRCQRDRQAPASFGEMLRRTS